MTGVRKGRYCPGSAGIHRHPTASAHSRLARDGQLFRSTSGIQPDSAQTVLRHRTQEVVGLSPTSSNPRSLGLLRQPRGVEGRLRNYQLESDVISWVRAACNKDVVRPCSD